MPDRTDNHYFSVNSPHELALGVAAGVLIGLIPKDSAIPWVLGLVLILSRGNLLCGIVAAVSASLISPALDGITDRMGASLLSLEFMQSQYAAWIEVPWMAWTRFNNTVVAGSLFLGALAALPVYLLSQEFFRVWGIRWIERVMATRVVRFVFGGSDSNLETAGPSPIVEA